jgi:hypothetical protein
MSASGQERRNGLSSNDLKLAISCLNELVDVFGSFSGPFSTVCMSASGQELRGHNSGDPSETAENEGGMSASGQEHECFWAGT